MLETHMKSATASVLTCRHDVEQSEARLKKAEQNYEGKFFKDGELTRSGYLKKPQREYRIQDIREKERHDAHLRVLEDDVGSLRTKVECAMNDLQGPQDPVLSSAADSILKMYQTQLLTKEQDLSTHQERGRTYRNGLGMCMDEAYKRAVGIEASLKPALESARAHATKCRKALLVAEEHQRQGSDELSELSQRATAVAAVLDSMMATIEANRQEALLRRAARAAARTAAIQPDVERQKDLEAEKAPTGNGGGVDAPLEMMEGAFEKEAGEGENDEEKKRDHVPGEWDEILQEDEEVDDFSKKEDVEEEEEHGQGEEQNEVGAKDDKGGHYHDGDDEVEKPAKKSRLAPDGSIRS